MVSLTSNQMISHQAYSDLYNRRQLIGIEEDSEAITHFVNFELNDHLVLIARVKLCLENPKIPSILNVNEDKIYYLHDRASIIHGSGVPYAATPLLETLQRAEIISKISLRKVVIVDIVIDVKYYEKLYNCSKSLDRSLVNKTYILMAPEPVHQPRTIPLKVRDPSPESSSSEDSQQSRKEKALDEAPPPSYAIELNLSPTPEPDL